MSAEYSTIFRSTLALLAIPLFAGCGPNDLSGSSAPELPGRSVFQSSVTEGLDRDALEAMRWQDIAPTVQAVMEHGAAPQVLDATAATKASPVLYFRGLLFLADDKPDLAAEAWNGIALKEFTPDALYPPWRVATERGVSPNRYGEPLARAVAENRTSPLVRARFQKSFNDT